MYTDPDETEVPSEARVTTTVRDESATVVAPIITEPTFILEVHANL